MRGRYLYQSSGPALGMAKIGSDREFFATDPIQYHGTIRYFWTGTTPTPEIVGQLTTSTAKLLDLSEGAFFSSSGRSRSRRPASRGCPTASPRTPRATASTSRSRTRPAWASTISPPMKSCGRSTFWKSGLMTLATAAARIAVEPRSGQIFVSFGMVDEEMHYKVVRIDPETFTIQDQLTIDHTGDNFILAPEINRAFDAVFYSGEIREMELFPRLRFIRNIPGPVCSRSMAFDSRRNYLYATSMVTGEFLVIDARRGTTLYRTYLGNKADNVTFQPQLDRVYISCGRGIYLFDPAAFDRLHPRAGLD